MIYFAYGSNMETTQMQARCPGHTLLGIGCLHHYTLAFTRWSRAWNSGTADILPEKGGEVWGVLYKLTLENLRGMDTFADYPHSYIRLDVPIEQEGEHFPAFTYVAVRQGLFVPSSAYMNRMISGAAENNIPESYIAFLKTFETHDGGGGKG